MVDEWARGSSAFGQVVEYRYFGIHHRIGDAEVSVPGDDKLLPSCASLAAPPCNLAGAALQQDEGHGHAPQQCTCLVQLEYTSVVARTQIRESAQRHLRVCLVLPVDFARTAPRRAATVRTVPRGGRTARGGWPALPHTSHIAVTTPRATTSFTSIHLIGPLLETPARRAPGLAGPVPPPHPGGEGNYTPVRPSRLPHHTPTTGQPFDGEPAQRPLVKK
ncbi:hypothetical protein ACCO45_006107 [Purpureocillium lilacinum]|uniref:Uncharacterized protein n=1 Tax=Purpureocillium lilacinum TaxID=33203 RepID=A0ACC4DX91_PURLI